MKLVPTCGLVLLAVGSLCGRVHADGKFYGERIPPDIPYQRGFILFHEGSQTLVLQSKYEPSDSAPVNSLGWVVPVPNVPEIAGADADAANIFFFHMSRATQPKVYRVSRYVCLAAVVLFVGSVAYVLVLLLEYYSLNKPGRLESAWRKRLVNSLIVATFAALTAAMTGSHLAIGSGVEVIKAEKAGIYDVKVLKSKTAEGISDWLKENGFDYGDGDVQSFENYVHRNWCFVAAKVQPEPGAQERKIVSGKMVAPLILKFKTDKAIYPLALTATVGAPTEVLLYTMSESKLTCGQRLTLRRATRVRNWKFSDLVGDDETQGAALFADVPKSATLCKFKKRLKPEEMKGDIVFDVAPDNQPYRETKIVWYMGKSTSHRCFDIEAAQGGRL